MDTGTYSIERLTICLSLAAGLRWGLKNAGHVPILSLYAAVPARSQWRPLNMRSPEQS